MRLIYRANTHICGWIDRADTDQKISTVRASARPSVHGSPRTYHQVANSLQTCAVSTPPARQSIKRSFTLNDVGTARPVSRFPPSINHNHWLTGGLWTWCSDRVRTGMSALICVLCSIPCLEDGADIFPSNARRKPQRRCFLVVAECEYLLPRPSCPYRLFI